MYTRIEHRFNHPDPTQPGVDNGLVHVSFRSNAMVAYNAVGATQFSVRIIPLDDQQTEWRFEICANPMRPDPSSDYGILPDDPELVVTIGRGRRMCIVKAPI
jgi:hypothetical protein